MAEIRQFPEVDPRVETGPVQFGDDWPGLFIRGDNCAQLLCELTLGSTETMTEMLAAPLLGRFSEAMTLLAKARKGQIGISPVSGRINTAEFLRQWIADHGQRCDAEAFQGSLEMLEAFKDVVILWCGQKGAPRG